MKDIKSNLFLFFRVIFFNRMSNPSPFFPNISLLLLRKKHELIDSFILFDMLSCVSSLSIVTGKRSCKLLHSTTNAI